MDLIKNHPGKENKRAGRYSEQWTDIGAGDGQSRQDE